MSWVTMPLGEIIGNHGGLIQTGPFGSQLHQHEYLDEGVPVVMPKDIRDGRVDEGTVARVSETKAQSLSRHFLKAGSIVFPRRGEISKCAYITEHQAGFLCGTGCIKIEPPEEILDPRFLYYYLGLPHVVQWLERNAIGTTMLNLNTEIIGGVMVPMLPKGEQQRIASTLSVYDDLIENNRRRIRLLEQSARLLYKEWFVHLRFPGHEHVKIKDGVPEGWTVTTLGQVCSDEDGIQTGPFGSQLHQSDYSEEGIPVVMPRELAGNKVSTHGIARVPEEIAERLSRHRLQIGDTVYGRRGDIGRRAYIRRREAGWLCGTGCLRLRPDPSKIEPRYFFDALGSAQTEGTIIARAQGATMPNLNASIMRSVELLVPSLSVQKAYVEHIDALDELISCLTAQNETLAKARDLLLPRLMSGELAA